MIPDRKNLLRTGIGTCFAIVSSSVVVAIGASFWKIQHNQTQTLEAEYHQHQTQTYDLSMLVDDNSPYQETCQS